MTKTFILQFEDMVFRNDIISSYIKEASLRFFETHLNNQDQMSVNALIHIIHECNNSVGFISIGKYLSDCEDSLQHYNHFVYSPLSVPTLTTFIQTKDYNLIQTLINLKNTYGFRFILCSDSPLSYCVSVFKAMNMSLFDLFDPHHIYTSDIVRSIKPNMKVFDYIEEDMFDTEHPLQYIGDENSSFLSNILNDKHWDVIPFKNTESLYSYLIEQGTINKEIFISSRY
jgi:hypothetical protein